MRRLPSPAWLRPALALLALAGVLSLTACGGGSGAVNGPNSGGEVVTAMSILPPSQTIYPGTTAQFTISGGVPPYRAFSSNGSILPVAQNVIGNTVVLLANSVSASTTVSITVQDSASQTAVSSISVAPPVLFPNGLTITPSVTTCGSAALCTGTTGTARVQATGIGGSTIANRAIRFDVVYGAFGILSTNPSSPLVQSMTVTTDNTGVAQVGIKALVDVTTQPAQISATDVSTGQVLVGNFTIIRDQDGSSFLTVIPDTATINVNSSTSCSSGVPVDYRIYGGTPPYRVTASFPTAVVIVNPIVSASGAAFTARTNGSCVDPLTFSILDSAGKQTTATLINTKTGTDSGGGGGGSGTLVVTPTNLGGASVPCSNTFQFAVSGGTPPYSIIQSSPASPSAVIDTSPLAAPGDVRISGLTGTSGDVVVYTFAVSDAFSPPDSTTVTITCLVP